MILGKKPFKNTAERGGNAGYQYFLVFPQYFLSYQKKWPLSAIFKLLSAQASNLYSGKIWSFGEGFKSLPHNKFKTSKLKELICRQQS